MYASRRTENAKAGELLHVSKDGAMRLSILLICSEAEKARSVEASLNHPTDAPYVFEWVASGAGGIQRLSSQTSARVHAILLSIDKPDCSSLELLDSLLKLAPAVPILILASQKLEDCAKLAVRRGAQDYILENDLGGYILSKAVRNMIERASNAEALFSANERAELTLSSIGDAVVSIDTLGNVTFLNPIAESLTGWPNGEAVGRPIDEVLRIRDNTPERHFVSPMTAVIRNNRAAKLAPGCQLMRRDSVMFAIEDSVAPIHDRTGQVTGAVMVFHDVTQAQAISKKMSHLAQHDYLTDLPNRLLLNDRLSQAIASARRNEQQLAVLFIDLDRFKHVNDSLGHAVGDKLLISIAKRLISCVRGSDTVSRQGGDEFVILLSSITHAEHAALSAQKLIAAIVMPHHIEDNNLQITISIGISVYPEDGLDAETLVKNADIAMLHAKDNGRNTFQFFKPNMNERALERQSIESGLRNAIERGEFVLHYQAKFDLVTEALTGAEALIRWQLPQRPLISPRDFIPIAERCGYIVPIGRWVLRQACMQNRIWRDAHLGAIPVAVNISAVELRSKHFVEHVRAILQETGAEPTSLEFELTETALMQDPQSTIAVLKQLKDMGIELTLDDFGTGYSSLSYLRRFPIDALKIDKSFVHGLCVNPNDAKIVSAVISLGRSFHLQVIAEGVETRAQFLALQGQDCGEGQGYYFQHPVAAREFTKLLGTDLSTTDVAY
jgi:diguanylate cyclase (GGDEF)-like protein/PAS domain S-box-containing protein